MWYVMFENDIETESLDAGMDSKFVWKIEIDKLINFDLYKTVSVWAHNLWNDEYLGRSFLDVKRDQVIGDVVNVNQRATIEVVDITW